MLWAPEVFPTTTETEKVRELVRVVGTGAAAPAKERGVPATEVPAGPSGAAESMSRTMTPITSPKSGIGPPKAPEGDVGRSIDRAWFVERRTGIEWGPSCRDA